MANDHAGRERWVGFVGLLLLVLLTITFLHCAQGLYTCVREEGIFAPGKEAVTVESEGWPLVAAAKSFMVGHSLTPSGGLFFLGMSGLLPRTAFRTRIL